MKFQQITKRRGKALLFAALATLSLATPASAVVIDSLTQAERDLDANGILDPFEFSFSGLAAPTSDSLFLDVDFFSLDLGQRTEVLGVRVVTSAGSYDIGPLDQTITGGNRASNNADGFGELEISFADIGDFTGGDLVLWLTTNTRIQAYHRGGTFRCTNNCEGSATATLSYASAPVLLTATSAPEVFQEEPESVPLPGTLALIGLGLAGARFARNRRPPREAVIAS